MRKFFSAIMALTVLLFVSCDKEDTGTLDVEGKETKMGLTISFPQTKSTAGYATADEVEVKTVSVFIFTASGNPALGNLTPLNISTDFTPSAGNVYTLKSDSRIETTSGSKRIYVGFNLPVDLLVKEATESALLAAASSGANNIGNLVASDGTIVMFSKCVETNLLPSDTREDMPEENKISVPVERLVAKVAVTLKNGEPVKFEDEVDPTNYYTLTPDKYTVGNLAPEYFPIQQFEGGLLSTPLMVASTPPLLPQKELNAYATNPDFTSTSFNAFYVPEHTTSDEYLRLEATYAVVRAKLVFSHTAKLNTTSDGVDYTQYVSDQDDIHVVTNGTNSYFVKDLTDASALKTYLGATYRVSTIHYASPSETTDQGRFVFYHLFLNKEEAADPLAVYRNQFIHMTITGVKGMGVPGDPTEPYEPPTKPDEPDPETDPVFKTAFLEVTASVSEWSYNPQNVSLE